MTADNASERWEVSPELGYAVRQAHSCIGIAYAHDTKGAHSLVYAHNATCDKLDEARAEIARLNESLRIRTYERDNALKACEAHSTSYNRIVMEQIERAQKQCAIDEVSDRDRIEWMVQIAAGFKNSDTGFCLGVVDNIINYAAARKEQP